MLHEHSIYFLTYHGHCLRFYRLLEAIIVYLNKVWTCFIGVINSSEEYIFRWIMFKWLVVNVHFCFGEFFLNDYFLLLNILHTGFSNYSLHFTKTGIKLVNLFLINYLCYLKQLHEQFLWCFLISFEEMSTITFCCVLKVSSF